MARAGWPVFPLVPGGREPYADEGVTFATTNTARIRAWFVQRPEMNYGIDATGSLIIDCDNKGGKKGGAAFKAIMGDTPETLTVRTPNNGLHFYFRAEQDFGQSPLAEGVDVRAFHGYVVGPGSAIDAGTYQIVRDVEAAPAPALLTRKLMAVAPEQYLPREQRQQPIGELDTPSAIAAGVRYLETDAPAGRAGGRNETGFRVACVLKDLGMSADRIGELMCEHWDCDLSEDFGPEALYELGQRAHKSGRLRPGARSAENDFADITDELEALGDTLSAIEAEIAQPADLAPDRELTEEEQQEAEKKRHAADMLAQIDAQFGDVPLDIDPRDVARRRWYVDGMLSPGLLTGLVAPPGVGKSTFILNVLAGLAVGNLDHMHLKCPEGPKRSLFLSVEEDPAEIYKRTWAAFHAHGLPVSEAKGRLKVPTANFQRMTFLTRKNGALEPTETATRLWLYCKKHKIDVIVLDPWVDMSEGDENSNSEVQRAVDLVRDLCRKLEMSGVIVHHSRKALAGALEAAGDANILRGAGALNGALRATFTLLRPTPDEAAVKGWCADEAAAHFRLDRAKGSYSPPGRDTLWFKQISVDRPCDYQGGTEAAPAIQYVDPKEQEARTKEDLADTIAAEMFAQDVDKMSMKDAIAVLQGLPMYEMTPANTLRKVLEAVFSGPAVVDGELLRLRNLGSQRAFTLEPAPETPRAKDDFDDVAEALEAA